MEEADLRLAFSINEAAVITNLGRDAIYAAIRSGALRALKLGRRTLIRRGDLETFLNELPPLVLPAGVKQPNGARGSAAKPP